LDQHRRRRPGAATVIAVLALFVALGGVSYAVTTAPKNSVVTKSIRNGAVTLPKIAKSTQKTLKATHPVVRTAPDSVPAGFALGTSVQCHSGEHATGGGVADPPSNNANSRVAQSEPVISNGDFATAGQTPTGWFGSAFNGSSGTIVYTIYAICAK